MSVKGSTPSPELVAAAALSAWARSRERVALLESARDLGSFVAALERVPLPPWATHAARRLLDGYRRAGIQTACMTEPGYPRLLLASTDPPPVLSFRGRLVEDDSLALAVVGSRRASRYGLEMARGLAFDLASAGLTIVSGLARGIDHAAHLGALDAGGRTIAVLGSGLENVYPREHATLADRIAESGAVISEFDVREPPRARNFPRRNRIITGMSLGTLVVEAALKSGSLVSARIAMEQDRDVFAVPGPALAPGSAGVHALIRDGAKLVTSAEDVLDELRPEVRELLRPTHDSERVRATHPERGKRIVDELDDSERALLTYLTHAQHAVDVDTLADHVDLSVDCIVAALCGLEIKGRIWSLEGGLYQARP